MSGEVVCLVVPIDIFVSVDFVKSWWLGELFVEISVCFNVEMIGEFEDVSCGEVFCEDSGHVVNAVLGVSHDL
jgi:hypothetical protein